MNEMMINKLTRRGFGLGLAALACLAAMLTTLTAAEPAKEPEKEPTVLSGALKQYVGVAPVEAIRKAGIAKGLVVQVDADSLELKELGDAFRVHLLLRDEAAVAKTQAAIKAAGLDGRFAVSLRKPEGNQRLPFGDGEVAVLIEASEWFPVNGLERARVLPMPGLCVTPNRCETKAFHNEKVRWFDEARISIWPWMTSGTYFMHLNFQPTVTAEVAEKWRPMKFDADAHVRMIKAAGAKYTLLNAVWHDSFALWDTKITDHKITKTPYGKDMLREWADACKKYGLPWFIYSAQRAPVGGKYGATAGGGDLSPYAECTVELMEEWHAYNPVGHWFDGSYFAAAALRRGRELNPRLILNDRAMTKQPVVGGYNGHGRADVFSYEQAIPTFRRTPDSMGGEWGNRGDVLISPFGWWFRNNYYLGRGRLPKADSPAFARAVEENFHYTLRMTLGAVGNDVGINITYAPEPDGTVHPLFEAVFLRLGDWLAKHGAGVYTTRGGPYYQAPPVGHYFSKQPGNHPNEPDLFRYHVSSTCKDDKIFLFLYDLDPGQTHETVLPALPVKPTAAKLADGRDVAMSQDKEGLRLRLAADAIASPVTVVTLTVPGDAVKIPPIQVPLRKTRVPLTAGKSDENWEKLVETGQVRDFVDVERVECDGKALYLAGPRRYRTRSMDELPPDFHSGLILDRDMEYCVGYLGKPDADTLPPEMKDGTQSAADTLPPEKVGRTQYRSWTFVGEPAKPGEMPRVQIIRIVFDAANQAVAWHIAVNKP